MNGQLHSLADHKDNSLEEYKLISGKVSEEKIKA